MHRFYSCTFLKYLFRATTLATHAARPFPAPNSLHFSSPFPVPPSNSPAQPLPSSSTEHLLEAVTGADPARPWCFLEGGKGREQCKTHSKRSMTAFHTGCTCIQTDHREMTWVSGNAAAEHPFVPPCLGLQGCLAFPSLPLPCEHCPLLNVLT